MMKSAWLKTNVYGMNVVKCKEILVISIGYYLKCDLKQIKKFIYINHIYKHIAAYLILSDNVR